MNHLSALLGLAPKTRVLILGTGDLDLEAALMAAIEAPVERSAAGIEVEAQTFDLVALGGEPPFTEFGAERWRTVDTSKDPTAICLPVGPSRAFTAPFPFLLVQGKDTIGILFEYQSIWRAIYMDGRSHPEDVGDYPYFMGHSVGRWEGDALVVDTTGTVPDRSTPTGDGVVGRVLAAVADVVGVRPGSSDDLAVVASVEGDVVRLAAPRSLEVPAEDVVGVVVGRVWPPDRVGAVTGVTS